MPTPAPPRAEGGDQECGTSSPNVELPDIAPDPCYGVEDPPVDEEVRVERKDLDFGMRGLELGVGPRWRWARCWERGKR